MKLPPIFRLLFCFSSVETDAAKKRLYNRHPKLPARMQLSCFELSVKLIWANFKPIPPPLHFSELCVISTSSKPSTPHTHYYTHTTSCSPHTDFHYHVLCNTDKLFVGIWQAVNSFFFLLFQVQSYPLPLENLNETENLGVPVPSLKEGVLALVSICGRSNTPAREKISISGLFKCVQELSTKH